MAVPRIKSTYSLPVETVAALERLATRWGVSRSEALSRAVASADASEPLVESLAALDAWQAAIALDAERAASWEANVLAERRARDVRTTGRAAGVADTPHD